MRLSEHQAIGSPAARAVYAAVLLTIIGLIVAGTAVVGVSVLGGPRTIVVDAAGRGDALTIAEGVALAGTGDTVLVRPGQYPGSVLVDKDITIRGDGSRDDVTVRFDATSPAVPSWTTYGPIPYGFLVVDATARVRDLSVVGPPVGVAFALVGGAPVIERVRVDLKGPFANRPQSAFALFNETAATIDDCDCTDGFVWEVEDLRDHPDVRGTGRLSISGVRNDWGIWVGPADGSVIADNTSTGSIGIEGSAGSLVISGNVVAGIDIQAGGPGLVIRDNSIDRSREVTGGVDATSGVDADAGIAIRTGAPLVEGNVVRETAGGIVVLEGASPTITGNVIERNRVGIDVRAADVVVAGNRFCANEQDLVVPDGSTLTLDASNTICPPGVSPAP